MFDLGLNSEISSVCIIAVNGSLLYPKKWGLLECHQLLWHILLLIRHDRDMRKPPIIWLIFAPRPSGCAGIIDGWIIHWIVSSFVV